MLREYLAYRLLNAMTDLSFRVRLLEVTWVDSDERRGRMVRSAFLIEHRNRLAARIGMEPREMEFAELGDISARSYFELSGRYQFGERAERQRQDGAEGLRRPLDPLRRRPAARE
mgnify:CR=1 FL=1